MEARGDMGDIEVYGESGARCTVPYWALFLGCIFCTVREKSHIYLNSITHFPLEEYDRKAELLFHDGMPGAFD